MTSRSEGDARPAPTSEEETGKGPLLGCTAVALALLVGIPLVLVAAGWFLLPVLLTPPDTEWTMPPVDRERTEEVVERLREAVPSAGEGPGHVEITEEELNLLLARAFADRLPPELPPEEAPRGRFRVEEGVVALDLLAPISEDREEVPGLLRGRTTGLELALRPRAADGVLAMGIDGARLGRIPLPVGPALWLVGRTPVGREAGLVDPETRELLLPLEGLEALPAGVTLADLEVPEGSIRFQLVR